MKEKVLILGGTEFVGRQFVEALQTEGSKEIFLFNRGKTNPDLFPKVTRIIGDRETDDVEQLSAYKWDYVIDFSSYFPKSLQKTLAQINRDVKKYIYISTIAVYDFESYDFRNPIDEDFPKVTCNDEEAIDPTMNTYGKKKIACEEVLMAATWLNAVILRPSIIYGRYDPTDRFYYWLRKVKKAKKILMPNDGNDHLCLTYSEDLVNILLASMEDKLPNGTYNCGTHEPVSFSKMLELMKKLLASACEFYGIANEELKKESVHLPLTYINNLIIDSSKIKAVLGTDFIPFEDSIQSLIDFYETEDWPACRIGMDEEQEAANN